MKKFSSGGIVDVGAADGEDDGSVRDWVSQLTADDSVDDGEMLA